MTMPLVKPELRNSEFDLLILSFMATSTSSITDHIYREYNQTSNFVLYAYTLAIPLIIQCKGNSTYQAFMF